MTIQNETTRQTLLTLYIKSTTPTRLPLIWMLARVGVRFDTVNLRIHPEAAVELAKMNHGRSETPAIVFNDGGILNRPSAFTLRKHLIQRGYHVTWAALLLGLSYDIAIVLGALISLIYLIVVG